MSLYGNALRLGGSSQIHPYIAITNGDAEFSVRTQNGQKNWDGTLEYSPDSIQWYVWAGSEEIYSSNGKLFLRGRGNSIISGNGQNSWWVLNAAGSVAVRGNLENLLDFVTVARGEHPQMGTGCFRRLFRDWVQLVSGPDLTAMALTESCYSAMFGNTGLRSAPKLPATILAVSCYESMFSDCASLVAIPELPAVEMQQYCYRYMFYGCTNLMMSATQEGAYLHPYRIPSSGTGVIATGALTQMFSGTGGTYKGDAAINTTYYTNHEPVTA